MGRGLAGPCSHAQVCRHGVNGGVIKAHGSSDGKAIYNALRQAHTWVGSGLVDVIGETMKNVEIED